MQHSPIPATLGPLLTSTPTPATSDSTASLAAPVRDRFDRRRRLRHDVDDARHTESVEAYRRYRHHDLRRPSRSRQPSTSSPRQYLNVGSAARQFQITTDVIDLAITIVERTALRSPPSSSHCGSRPRTRRLALDAAELALINAATLRFGDNLAGDLHLSAPVVASGVTNLHLHTGGGVSGVGTITATNLAVEAVGDVQLANANNVQTLAIHTTGPAARSRIAMPTTSRLTTSTASAASTRSTATLRSKPPHKYHKHSSVASSPAACNCSAVRRFSTCKPTISTS